MSYNKFELYSLDLPSLVNIREDKNKILSKIRGKKGKFQSIICQYAPLYFTSCQNQESF